MLVVAITIALNALDGFDVLSIGFASPASRRSGRSARAALGFVLSMELIGMALGSIFLGSLADKIGRRPTVLGCLVAMAPACSWPRPPTACSGPDAGVRTAGGDVRLHAGRSPRGPVDVENR